MFVTIFFVVTILTLLAIFGLFKEKNNTNSSNSIGKIVSEIKINNKILISVVIFIVFLILFYFFWDTIKEEVTSFDWTSISPKNAIEKQFGTGSAMWIWVVIGVAILAYFGNKVTAAMANGILVVFFILFMAIAIPVFMFGEDKVKDGFAIMAGGKATSHSADCTERAELEDVTSYKGKRDIKVCVGTPFLILVADYKTRLSFALSPKFVKENEHLLGDANVDDFVNILSPGNFAGSTAGSYKLVVKHDPNNLRTSAFTRHGLDHIVITVSGD